MQTFNEIYLFNLHGNAKKKEVCPDGSNDKNVFDIQQGVAIGIFIKRPDGPTPAQVYYDDLWGLRICKEKALAEMDLSTTTWRGLQPQTPFYLFMPQDTNLLSEYEQGWKITDIFQRHNVGIITKRDALTIHQSKEGVWQTVNDFAVLSQEDARYKYNLPDDVRDWKIEWAQRDLQKSGLLESKILPVLYRPFDIRFTFYTGNSRGFLGWPFEKIMRHMLMDNNLALCASRGTEIVRGWEHIFCSKLMIQHHTVSLKEVNYLFPLYLYQKVLGQTDKTANINPTFIDDLSAKVGLAFIPDRRGDMETTFGPEDVFSYAYAVFHSPAYRQRYSEFLKGDFPRLPLTGNETLFAALAGLGAELAALHLMESPALERFITTFPVSGSQLVEGVRYEENSRRVYINAQQYFEGVPPEVWAFTIGGYQVCHKWLKDRKGRTLSDNDQHHYQKIVVALAETIRLMGGIDTVIDANGGWPIDGKTTMKD